METPRNLERGKVVKMCVEKFKKQDIQHLKHLKYISKSPDQYDKLSAAFYTAKLWPNNSVIKVAFMEQPGDIVRTSLLELEAMRDESGGSLKIDPLQYQISESNMDIIPAIKKIVNERINPITNLKFIFIDNIQDAHIRITFDPNQGAWSLVGTDCIGNKNLKEPTMNLGWFDVGTTIHEFGHALGLVHEHQNPRGKKIEWDLDKVYQWAENSQGWDHDTTYRNIVEKYSVNQVNGSTFDPNSIMLYFFPGNLTLNDQGTHQNYIFSPTDVLYINSVYPNSPESPQKFYKSIYGKEIGPSLKTFSRTSSNEDSGSDIGKNVGIAIAVVIGLTLLGLFIAYVIKKKQTLQLPITKV